MKEVLIGGYYNHYKNKSYQVTDLATHSESLESLVIYKALYKNEISQTWARPEKMFLEKMPNGTDRFELLPVEKWPISFDFFHSHIYYTPEVKPKALNLQKKIKDNFASTVRCSGLHDQLMGPHPFWMFEADFKSDLFLDMIDFLIEHRDGLSILIHPLSGNAVLDHTDYALFLGRKEKLNISIF
jgi:aromatic ring-cleaving dioxygenase